jgi:hypothetical protein
MNLSNGVPSGSVTLWLTLHSWTLNSTANSVDDLQDNSSTSTSRKTPFSVVKNVYLLARYLAMDICKPHRRAILRHWFYFCMCVFRALPRNGSTYHSIKYCSLYPTEFTLMNVYYSFLYTYSCWRCSMIGENPSTTEKKSINFKEQQTYWSITKYNYD